MRAGKKRGSRKGDTKPFKRPLDDGFPGRLKAAMRRRGYVTNTALADEVGCERATIGQYLNTEKRKKSIDALLLLALCDELYVTPYWLALDRGKIEDIPIPTKAARKVAETV